MLLSSNFLVDESTLMMQLNLLIDAMSNMIINQPEIFFIKNLFPKHDEDTKTQIAKLIISKKYFLVYSLCKLIPSDVDITNKLFPIIAAHEGDG